MTAEEIARVCHEAIRTLQLIQGDPVPVPPWEDAAGWQRDASIESVQAALLGQTPREQHESWAAVKLRLGWRYGPVKDPEAKTHPCLVDYDELPDEQQAKDRLLLGIVGALATD